MPPDGRRASSPSSKISRRLPMRVEMIGALIAVLLVGGAGTILVDSRLTRQAVRDQIDERLEASAAVLRSAYDLRLTDMTGHLRDLAQRIASLDVDVARASPAVIAELSAASRVEGLDVVALFEEEGPMIARVGPRVELPPRSVLGSQGTGELVRAADGRWMQTVQIPVTVARRPMLVIGGFFFGDAFAYQLRSVVHDDVVLFVGGRLTGSTIDEPVQEIEQILEQDGASPRVFHLPNRDAFARPLQGEGPLRMAVVVTKPVAALDASLARTRLIAGAVLLVIAGTLGWLLFSYLTRPLGAVRRMAARIAEGTLDPAEGLPQGGEFGAITVSLERIAQRVGDMERQERESAAFVARAAHELRNPLTSIVGLAETLASRRDVMSPDDAERCLVALARGCEQLGQLAGSLLDLSQLEQRRLPIRAAMLDLAAVVDEAIESVPPPSTVTVRNEVLASEAVWGDVVRIREVLVNLLVNAYRHGGTVVSVGVEEDAADPARLLVWVADDGPGVDPGLIPTLFEPFVRGPSSGDESSGLGLAIARGLVEAHGGEIWYEQGDPGARFVFSLPRPNEDLRGAIDGVITRRGDA